MQGQTVITIVALTVFHQIINNQHGVTLHFCLVLGNGKMQKRKLALHFSNWRIALPLN